MGGGFYAGVLSYSVARCLRYLFIFLFIIAFVMTIYFFRIASNFYDKGVKLFESNDYKVVFDKGVIANMPANLKLIPFEGDTMAVWEWIVKRSDADSLRQLYPNISLFVGPRGIFTYRGTSPQAMSYPADFTATVDAEYLRNFKQGYSWIAFLAMLVLLFLIFIPWSALAILIFIIPILSIKFARIGMKFGLMWKLGMFLVCFHFLYFVITMVADINIPYAWVLNFPIYIFAVTFLVKIDKDYLEKLKRSG